MNLEEPVSKIKNEIRDNFHKRLTRLGIVEKELNPRDNEDEAFNKAHSVINSIQGNEDKSYPEAREKYLQEVTFTLFNRIAGLKVMEKHRLIPEVITTRAEHGDRSFAHNVWLEDNPDYRRKRLEGLSVFIKDKFAELSGELTLYSPDYPYDLLPAEHDLRDIINLFNEEIEEERWEEDDILGWMYEAYNKKDYKLFKDSGDKTEWDKLSLSSQMYTPRWVVEFLVNNSLGKYWLEINPYSEIKENHDIANAPEEQILEEKEITEIKVIDPAAGSGNFLLYAFDLLSEIYEEEGYNREEIPNLIIKNNLYGLDIDERAVQIARLQLYIKAKRYHRQAEIEDFNVVSSSFRLPDFKEIRDQFDENLEFTINEGEFIKELWHQLQQAYKFGSLIQLKEHMADFLEKKQEQDQLGLFDGVLNPEEIEIEVINKLKDVFAVSLKNGFSTRFLKHQSLDALKFAEIMLGLKKNNGEYEVTNYDIAVTNPPYTDSSNFGKELKDFVNTHYKEPIKFHQNLYASFLKKNSDLINEQGKIGMIHPLTFMYIKSYEDVRDYILNNYHINILVDYGLDRRNLFGPGILLNSALHVLERTNDDKKSTFFDVNSNLQEKYKMGMLENCLKDYIAGTNNNRVYLLLQDKIKIIDGYPFIYWISDSFREKFKCKSIDDFFHVLSGIKTSNNDKYLRYWWEVEKGNEAKEWPLYAKGGPFNKWFGNLWLCIDWRKEGKDIAKHKTSSILNKKYRFKKAITYSAASSKGISFRYLPKNCLYDMGGSAIHFTGKYNNIYYTLGFLNSSLIKYITECFNPTVNIQISDIKRVPFIKPDLYSEKSIKLLTKNNIKQKKEQYKFNIIEKNFDHNPLMYLDNYNIKQSLINYIEFKFESNAQILLNEALIDDLIFKVYELTESDREMVLEQESLPPGMQPVYKKDKNKFLENQEELVEEIKEYITNLPVENERSRANIKDEVYKLYKKNQPVKKIADELEINPISVVEMVKEFDVYPKKLAYQKSHELILDLCRDILNENEDGIIMLNEYAGEDPMDKKIKDRLYKKGFSAGDINRLESMLGKGIKDYLLSDFFGDECDTLNLFMYQPKTPFVWHLSSGKNHGFDAFTIIYRWSRDSVMKIKSYYIDKRKSGLNNRLSDLAEDDSASAEKEKDKIRKQLNEIEEFEEGLDELLSSGYEPVMNDGVGKNIAPLQDLGLLAEDVLTSSQLDKFLNAEW